MTDNVDYRLVNKANDNVRELRDILQDLFHTGHGGNPPGGNGLEARVAKLEVAVEYIHRDVAEIKSDIKDLRTEINGIRTTDFRLLFGAVIAVALGLTGVMAKGFGWL